MGERFPFGGSSGMLEPLHCMRDRHRKKPRLEMPQWFPTFARGVLRAGIFVAVLVGVVWLWRIWDPQAFMEWRREAGPVPFFLALAILPAVGFPTTPFYIMAGATFAPWVTVVGIAVSLAIHVTMCYWVAHSWMRRILVRILRRTKYQLPVLDQNRALRFALLVKMAPGVPTFFKTYLIGMSGISFPAHFAICFGITGCYAAAFVVLGDSLVQRDPATAALGLGILAAVVVALYFIRRYLRTGEEGNERDQR